MINLSDIVVKFGDFEALHSINVRAVRMRQNHNTENNHRIH